MLLVKHTWPCLWVHIQCHFWKIYWNCNSWCTGWITWVLFPTCIWKIQINWSSIMQEWQHMLTTNNLLPCASGILVTPLDFGKHPLLHGYSLSVCNICWKVSIANSDGKTWVWKLSVNSVHYWSFVFVSVDLSRFHRLSHHRTLLYCKHNGTWHL